MTPPEIVELAPGAPLPRADFLQIKNVCKDYRRRGAPPLRAIDNVSFEVTEREICVHY